MSVERSAYRPPFASEKLLPGPPYRGCRVSSVWHALAIATLGETTLLPTGRPKGSAAKASDLRRGWRGFLGTADDNGWPDQPDAYPIQERMFSGYPKPTVVSGGRFPDVWAAVGQHAVSIALNLAAVPADSPLRRYVGPVPHQVVIDATRDGEGRVICPMHAPSDSYQGHWCPVDDIRKAALAIESGGVYAELYPVGGWTKARLVSVELNRELNATKATLRTVRAKNLDLQAEVARLEKETAGGDQAAEAAREQLLDALGDWIAEQREE